MDEEKQFQDEYEQRLQEALDKVGEGYITEDYMAIIRHACNMPKAPTKSLLTSVFNFDEIFNDFPRIKK
jgi:hypothetical protein